MDFRLLGCIAAVSLNAIAAEAVAPLPVEGPLYACQAPLWSADRRPVVAWAEADAVVVVPRSESEALPAYLFADGREFWGAPPQRLRLVDHGFFRNGETTLLALSPQLVLACEPNSED
jgi:hypothetical protein